MIAMLRRALIIPALAIVLCFSFAPTALAAPYGAGAYGACEYGGTTECATGGTSGAPNTGVEHQSLLWPTVAAVAGFAIISFVTIRVINHRSGQKA